MVSEASGPGQAPEPEPEPTGKHVCPWPTDGIPARFEENVLDYNARVRAARGVPPIDPNMLRRIMDNEPLPDDEPSEVERRVTAAFLAVAYFTSGLVVLAAALTWAITHYG